jgi:hypothetical protein
MLPGARVLASYDDRDPAVLRIPIGKGGVIVFTSDWSPRDSQLALSSKFVPLLHAILDESAGLPPARAQYFVGEEIPLPQGAQPFVMRKPDGTGAPVSAGGKFSGTDQPGIYVANPGELRFVVNLDPEESRSPVSALPRCRCRWRKGMRRRCRRRPFTRRRLRRNSGRNSGAGSCSPR